MGLLGLLRRPLVLLILLVLVGLMVLGAGWSALKDAVQDDHEIEVESWDARHVQSHYEIVFGHRKEGAKDVTGVQDTSLRLAAANGVFDSKVHQGPDESIIERPDCATKCWKGQAFLQLESRPGMTWQGTQQPMTRWVAWDRVVDVPIGGETTWTFKSHHPGIYGAWTMRITHGSYVYEQGAWGDRYEWRQEESIVEEFDFKQA